MDWPSTLPAPLWEGSGGQDKPNLQRTKMETGPDRVTRIAKAHITELSLKWIFNAEQMATFRAFVTDGISGGADWFDMTVDTGGGRLVHRCRLKTGGFKWRRKGRWYEVSAEIETDERHLLWG